MPPSLMLSPRNYCAQRIAKFCVCISSHFGSVSLRRVRAQRHRSAQDRGDQWKPVGRAAENSHTHRVRRHARMTKFPDHPTTATSTHSPAKRGEYPWSKVALHGINLQLATQLGAFQAFIIFYKEHMQIDERDPTSKSFSYHP